jgi:RNA polymerase sigma factor (sigma-70 family)
MHADRAGRPPQGGAAGVERALQLPGTGSTLDQSVPAQWVADFDDERARRIDRLAADVDLHTRLALQGFTGREYEKFRLELARYGLAVMTGWLRNGKIFARMKEKGYGLPSTDETLLDHEAQDELAHETVAKALRHFHDDVLLQRKWDPTKGARLTTFFIGQCLMRFANIYRDWRRQEMRSRDLVDAHEAIERNEARTPDTADPQWIAVARHRIRRATRGIQDQRLQPVLELLITGRTQTEIAQELGLTVKTVERLLANHRHRIKQLGIA